MNIFAYTPSGETHPPYISINETEKGDVSITMRQGTALNHAIVNLELPLEELEIMYEKIGSYLVHRLGK